ncbi:hypothetical protein C8R47DRAFT_1160278 [Mycena vitilis]|nr:hypothetical protein C8R47DRAFT_1160278 [Mycena vitilis]
MMLFHSVSYLILIFIAAHAKPTFKEAPLSSRVIYQSPDSLFIENIAVRASSELLLTSVASPTLFALDPTTVNGTLQLVHTFPNANSLSGITEYHPNVFAIAASVIDPTSGWIPGSVVIWSIDFNPPAPVARILAAVPGANSTNGLTALPSEPDTLLLADSFAGIWQIDARTGSARLALQDPTMLPGGPGTLGINGIHVRDEHLYFTNLQQATYARVPLCVEHGNLTAGGSTEVFSTLGAKQGPDDFTFDRQGRAWMAVHPGALALFSQSSDQKGNWTQQTAVGNANGTDVGMIQPTSVAFGRGSSVQGNTLYVTTDVGQVLAVDIIE